MTATTTTTPEGFPAIMDAVLWEPAPGTCSMTINGIPTGDPLSDNNYTDDGYRFHDVFHLTHAALLHWSPTLRALLRRARNQAPDRTRDGHLAVATEEGIVALVFTYARARRFPQGAAGVDPRLLRQVTHMTECFQLPSLNKETWKENWERAILTGYRLWSKVRDQEGGRLRLDINQRTIDLLPATPDTA